MNRQNLIVVAGRKPYIIYKNKTMEQIIRNKFAELNESASAKWEDNKELSLESYKNENGNIYITIGIGKWNTTYHDVKIDTQSLEYVVIRESKRNAILYDVIFYVIMPLVSK